MMRPVLVCFLSFVSISAGQRPQMFTGSISDDMCATTGHAAMRMGPTDAECTEACVMAHGATYVLVRGKNVWSLSDQKLPAKYAGQNVRVTGTLDAKTRTIKVAAISAQK